MAASSEKLKKRFIQLNKEHNSIRWGRATVPLSSIHMSEKKDKKISEKTLDRHVLTSQIEKVIYGPRSLTWQKFQVGASWRCISLVVNYTSHDKKKEVRRRTIDLQFASENETLAWLIGLNFLVSETKKKNAKSAVEFEARRDAMINKKLSEYKWIKFRLHVAEFARVNTISVGKGVGLLVANLLGDDDDDETEFEELTTNVERIDLNIGTIDQLVEEENADGPLATEEEAVENREEDDDLAVEASEMRTELTDVEQSEQTQRTDDQTEEPLSELPNEAEEQFNEVN